MNIDTETMNITPPQQYLRRKTNSRMATRLFGVVKRIGSNTQIMLLLNIILLTVLYTIHQAPPPSTAGRSSSSSNANYNINNNANRIGSISNMNSGAGWSSSSSSSSASLSSEPKHQHTPCLPVAAVDKNTRPIQKQKQNDDVIGRTATVLAMGTGYPLVTYQKFVGSLRKTGYVGNIIIVVAPTIDDEAAQYLDSQQVTMRKAQYIPCAHPIHPNLAATELDEIKDSHERELMTCLHPYPTLKNRWARFPVLRDYLLACTTCGGPVLITDMRDVLFQRNPFGPDAPSVEGLQVMEEFHTIRTSHWLVDWPVGECKNVHTDEPMLCSGTTIGTHRAMIDYLNSMHAEMNLWMNSTECCCFGTNGDDQSIHNYLYYSGILEQESTTRRSADRSSSSSSTKNVHAIVNRQGLVHTVGAQASLIFNAHKHAQEQLRKLHNITLEGAHADPYLLSREDDNTNWLGMHYGLTDAEGYLLNYDGTRSYIIHQYDRFGLQYEHWIQKNKETLYL